MIINTREGILQQTSISVKKHTERERASERKKDCARSINLQDHWICLIFFFFFPLSSILEPCPSFMVVKAQKR